MVQQSSEAKIPVWPGREARVRVLCLTFFEKVPTHHTHMEI
jgi:hypothetical protein